MNNKCLICNKDLGIETEGLMTFRRCECSKECNFYEKENHFNGKEIDRKITLKNEEADKYLKLIEDRTKVRYLIGNIISHNEIVTINIIDPADDHYKLQIWKGMGHQLPEEFLNKKFVKIFGCIPENILDSDNIHILIED